MAQLQPIDTTTLQPNGDRGDPAKTAFEKVNFNFAALQAAADMSAVSAGADQALYWNGTTWVPYTVSSLARTLLARATAALMRTDLGAVGTAGNETVAGNKTFSGNTTFTGGVDGTLQSDALPTNSATRQWIRVAALPWSGTGASILQFDMTTGAIGGVDYVRDTVSASARNLAAGTVMTQALADQVLSHQRQGSTARLNDADVVGVRVATDGTGLEVWIQHNPYNHGHSLIRRNASNVTYYGRTLSAQVSNTAPAGLFYATVKLIATTDDVAVPQAAAVAAQTTANTANTTANLALGRAAKNYLINGDFRFWQRGTSFSGDTYNADRFFSGIVAMTGATVSRGDVSPGNAGYRTNPRYAAVCNYSGNSSAASHGFTLCQAVEDVRSLAGVPSVVSFTVFNSGAAGRQIAVEFQQIFGTGGTTPLLGLSVQKFTLAAGFNYISVPVTLPSILGKAIGPNSGVVLVIWLTAGTSFNSRTASLGAQAGSLTFSAMQWETGSTASPFEYRSDAEELALCQRYYEKSYDLDVVPGTAERNGCVRSGNSAGGFFLTMGSLSMKVNKRVAPAVTTYATRTANNPGQGSEVQGGGVYTGLKPVNPANMGVAGFNVGGDGYTAGSNIEFHWTADAEL